MNNRFFLAPIAFAISAAFIGAAASPAMAGESKTCVTTPAQLREVAATAQPSDQRQALSLVDIGEKLCAAGGRKEASKKFAAAAKLLGTDIASLSGGPAAQ